MEDFEKSIIPADRLQKMYDIIGYCPNEDDGFPMIVESLYRLGFDMPSTVILFEEYGIKYSYIVSLDEKFVTINSLLVNSLLEASKKGYERNNSVYNHIKKIIDLIRFFDNTEGEILFTGFAKKGVKGKIKGEKVPEQMADDEIRKNFKLVLHRLLYESTTFEDNPEMYQEGEETHEYFVKPYSDEVLKESYEFAEDMINRIGNTRTTDKNPLYGACYSAILDCFKEQGLQIKPKAKLFSLVYDLCAIHNLVEKNIGKGSTGLIRREKYNYINKCLIAFKKIEDNLVPDA